MTNNAIIKEMEDQAAAYELVIEKLENEKNTILDGKPIKELRADGMYNWHPKYNEIKKIEYKIADYTHRLSMVTNNITSLK